MREFDRFLFPDGKATTGHQSPVYNHKSRIETCDVYVTQLREDGCPGNPVLVGDAKVDGLYAAEVETFAFCSRSHRVKEQRLWVTNLGLAYTKEEAVLFVSVGDDGYINVIEICTSDKPSVFFSVLFAAVQFSY